MAPVLTKSAFAKARGVDATRVSQWVAAGLPVRRDGKIDVAAGEAWIAENLDHGRRNGWQGDDGQQADNRPTLADARRTREQLRAERERLALDRDRGELVPRADVRRFLEARGRFDRDSHLSWCARIAARMSADFGLDAGKVHAFLETEMRAHLRELSETPILEQTAISIEIDSDQRAYKVSPS